MDERTERILTARAESLARPLAGATGRGAAGPPYLAFSARAARYGVPLASTEEVRPLPRPQPLAGGPPWLAGLIAVGGRPVALVDTGHYFSGQPTPAQPADVGTLAVVVTAGALEAALMAEDIEAMLALSEDDVVELPPGATARLAESCDGLAGDRLLLSPERLLVGMRREMEAMLGSGGG